MIKFVSDFRQVSGDPGTPVSSTNNTDHDITEILLKVALNTINLSMKCLYQITMKFTLHILIWRATFAL